jgi:hypothetical protein
VRINFVTHNIFSLVIFHDEHFLMREFILLQEKETKGNTFAEKPTLQVSKSTTDFSIYGKSEMLGWTTATDSIKLFTNKNRK